MAKVFNKSRADFETVEEYNDFLEAAEDIVYKLVHGIERDATKASLEQYQRDNQNDIAQNGTLGTTHPPSTNHPSPITHHLSPITKHPSPITHHPSPITHHQSPQSPKKPRGETSSTKHSRWRPSSWRRLSSRKSSRRRRYVVEWLEGIHVVYTAATSKRI